MNISTDRKTVVFLGAKSEIAHELNVRMTDDGWTPEVWARGWPIPDFRFDKWDLCVVAIGQVVPVGPWYEQEEWDSAIESNVLLPVRLLRAIWHAHSPGASICFMAGANPNKPMAGYSAYSVGKMALLKACEHLDMETPDAKFFALGPGTVLTKIHDATRKAKWKNPVLEAADKEGEDRAAKIERIYGCLKWCIEQPKEIIGGRNICASDHWDQPWYANWLRLIPSRNKLRRIER